MRKSFICKDSSDPYNRHCGSEGGGERDVDTIERKKMEGDELVDERREGERGGGEKGREREREERREREREGGREGEEREREGERSESGSHLDSVVSVVKRERSETQKKAAATSRFSLSQTLFF